MRGNEPARPNLSLPEETEAIVKNALAEDVGAGDITTDAIVAPDTSCDAIIMTKAECVVCGLAVARMLFQTIDSGVSLEALVAEGGGRAHTPRYSG